MEEFSLVQLIITALLSSGFMGGLITLVTKRVWSPESKNDLARVGSEFAQLLLEEARTEREELRATIKELETISIAKDEIIKRLEILAQEKDAVIRGLESRQYIIASKIQRGEIISLTDVFGVGVGHENVHKILEQNKKHRDGRHDNVD